MLGLVLCSVPPVLASVQSAFTCDAHVILKALLGGLVGKLRPRAAK